MQNNANFQSQTETRLFNFNDYYVKCQEIEKGFAGLKEKILRLN